MLLCQGIMSLNFQIIPLLDFVLSGGVVKSKFARLPHEPDAFSFSGGCSELNPSETSREKNSPNHLRCD